MIGRDLQAIWVGSQDLFDRPPKGFFVAAPVAVYRVIVETPLGVHDSDPFARVVVNLVTAGVQRVEDIATLIGIEDLAFLNEIVRRLAAQRLLAVSKDRLEVADLGRPGDNTSTKHVWFLIQDEHSGLLWPRVVTHLRNPELADDPTLVELGTPGRPERRRFTVLTGGRHVEPPDQSTIRHAINRHLADVRTVGFKPGRPGTEHLGMLGSPEQKPIFSARLAPGVERARLLVTLEAINGQIIATDPFGVGNWLELGRWTEMVVDSTEGLREKVSAWSARQRTRANHGSKEPKPTDETPPLRGGDGVTDRTMTRRIATEEPADRNTLLLRLADNLRAGIRNSSTGLAILTYDSTIDMANLERRWNELGFNIPDFMPRLVPALINRALDGSPAELHVLFYAWTLTVSDADGRDLAAQVPDLPSILSRNANDSTRTIKPYIPSIMTNRPKSHTSGVQ